MGRESTGNRFDNKSQGRNACDLHSLYSILWSPIAVRSRKESTLPRQGKPFNLPWWHQSVPDKYPVGPSVWLDRPLRSMTISLFLHSNIDLFFPVFQRIAWRYRPLRLDFLVCTFFFLSELLAVPVRLIKISPGIVTRIEPIHHR